MGRSLEKEGPLDSALASEEPIPLLEGNSAVVNTSTPMPPNQWVKQRRKLTLFGNTETSSIIVAPVVVKPLAISKKASASPQIFPRTSGSAPITDMHIQLRPAIAIPSRVYICLLSGLIRSAMGREMTRMMPRLLRKVTAIPSW